MSAMYGATDEAQSIATIHAALDAGVNLLDIGDFRARLPRFAGENGVRNQKLVDELE